MWGIPAAIFFIAFLHRVAPGIVAKDIMEAFGASGAIVGLLSSMYFYSYAGFMIPGGSLIDALGARRVVAAGGAVMGAGTLAMAGATTEPLLFAGRFVVGLGATVTFTGTLAIGAAWFPPSQFGTISAVTATVGVAGALAGTYPLAALVDLAGWRGAFAVLGVAALALAAPCAIVVRDRPPGMDGSVAPAPRLAEVVPGLIQVLGNRHTWPPFLAFFFVYAAWGNLMLWAVPFLRDVYGLSSARAALYAMATSLALIVSSPTHRLRVGSRAEAAEAPVHGAHRRLVPPLGRVHVDARRGAARGRLRDALRAWASSGGSFVLTWPLGREVNPPALGGIAVAVVNLGGFLGAALSQGAVGAVLDARWTGVMAAGARVYPVEAYRAAFAVCAAFALAAALMTLGLRETRGENVYQERAAPAGRSACVRLSCSWSPASPRAC